MNAAFQERGYVLKPQVYQNCYAPLAATHSVCGTEMQLSYHRLTHGAACLGCSKRPRANSEEATTHAAAKGGRLVGFAALSKNNSTWECKQGHQWRASWSRVKNGSWCPECAGKTSTSRSLARARKHFYQYQRQDAKKGFETTITVADVEVAQVAICVYCTTRQATGLDRKDNNRGHTPDNVVPSCWRCNFVRGDNMTHETMLRVGQVLKEMEP